MIKYDNKEFRNLVEQVQYLTDYHDVNQGLVQWGIKVIGQVETANDLPTPYDGDYGDAIAVGTEAPFFFYIWTRASIEGNPAYWFPFGEISIVGPQGPEGPQGPKGDTGESTKWRVGYAPQITGNEKIGDLALDTTNGNVYSFMANQWVYVTNIKGPQGLRGVQGLRGPQGPQGPVGPKGDTGDTGGLVNIAGIVDNVNQLPTPASLNNITIAYLVGTSDPRDLYIQVGTEPAIAQWNNIGPVNTATLVFVNGEAQNIWDADTKVDKLPGGSTLARAYVEYPDGKTIGYAIDNGSCTQYRLAEYKPINDGVNAPGGTGSLLAPDPQNPYQVANKHYVDTKTVPTAGTGTLSRVYMVYPDGSNTAVEIDNGICQAYRMPQYKPNTDGNTQPSSGGILLSSDPTKPYQVATKHYVDTNFVTKPAAPAQPSLIAQLANGTITQLQYGRTTPEAWTIPAYLANGQLPAGTPTEDNHAATKKYVDDLIAALKSANNLT